MPLPPEAQYPSKEALFEAIQAWAKPRGYAFTIGRSTKREGSGRIKVIYTCDRHILFLLGSAYAIQYLVVQAVLFQL